MRLTITLFLLALSSHCHSQDAGFKRSALFFENAAKFPKELGAVRTWLIGFTSQLPYMYRNGKISPNNDAEFRQFSLSNKKTQRFAIGNSGCYFQTDSSAVQQNVQYEGKWKIAAYDPSFQLNEFKPADNEKIYTTSLLIFNISEEQAMARFLNSYVSNKNGPVMEQFIRDAENLTGKKLELINDGNLRLKTVAQEIYLRTNEYASAICYRIYLKDKDPKKERSNVNQFLRSFSGNDGVYLFFDKVTPEGKFYFQNGGMSLTLPNEIFLYVDEQNKLLPAADISFTAGFEYASYKILYDEEDKPYFNLKFEKLHYNNQIPSFQLKEEYNLNKNMFRIFPFKQRRTFKATDIKEIDFRLYEGFFKIAVVLSDGERSSRPYTVFEKKINYK